MGANLITVSQNRKLLNMILISDIQNLHLLTVTYKLLLCKLKSIEKIKGEIIILR